MLPEETTGKGSYTGYAGYRNWKLVCSFPTGQGSGFGAQGLGLSCYNAESGGNTHLNNWKLVAGLGV